MTTAPINNITSEDVEAFWLMPTLANLRELQGRTERGTLSGDGGDR